MATTTYVPVEKKLEINWPFNKETFAQADTAPDALPIITSLSITKMEGNFHLVEIETQGAKVLSAKVYQNDLRSNVIDQFKLKALNLYEGN